MKSAVVYNCQIAIHDIKNAKNKTIILTKKVFMPRVKELDLSGNEGK